VLHSGRHEHKRSRAGDDLVVVDEECQLAVEDVERVVLVVVLVHGRALAVRLHRDLGQVETGRVAASGEELDVADAMPLTGSDDDCARDVLHVAIVAGGFGSPHRAATARMPGMTSLPSGTVTFVFSDIEGSTSLLKRLGDRYAEVLAEHRRLVRETFGAQGGVEIDTQGDAFFFAFARARDAVGGAVAVQRAHAEHAWPEGETVRVRMGLHTGEPAVGEEGYLGIDVVRAARLGASGKGGHVLLSETTRALLGSALPEGVSVHPLGERQLKDIDEPERIYELEIDGVDATADDGGLPAEREPDAPWERRTEELARRMSERINESVFRSLERSLGKLDDRR
jgi:class 3 adenylate cyclase